MEEIRESLGQPRHSLSLSCFSPKDFQDLQLANVNATRESHIMKTIIPVIEGDSGDTKCDAGDILFNNFDHLTDGTLVPAKPDYYHGARPEQIDRLLRDKLSGAIIPSTQGDLPAAPNFFIGVKGPDGTAAVAMRQIMYDMALGERGQTALLDYHELNPIYDNKAHTIGCTLIDGHLKMYATHRVPPSKPEAHAEYVMTLIDSWTMFGTLGKFREAATAYRNARDWAKRQRNEAIKKANESAAIPDGDTTLQATRLKFRVSSQEAVVEIVKRDNGATTKDQDSIAPSFHDSDTSADELPLDKLPVRRSRGIRKRFKPSSCSL